MTAAGRNAVKPKPRAGPWRVKVGIDYPPDRRAEPGDKVSDLPARSVGWLLEQGVIEPWEEAPDG